MPLISFSRALPGMILLLLFFLTLTGVGSGQTSSKRQATKSADQAKPAKKQSQKGTPAAKPPKKHARKGAAPAKKQPAKAGEATKPAKKKSTKSAQAVKPARRSRTKALRAPRVLSPALVDSFRTIILTSCADAELEPWELTMREEMVKWLSVRYRRAGISMSGVDCSGFIKTLFRTTLSVDLPHSAAQQASLGIPVERGDLRFGDLIFFRAKKRINHVGIYLGDGYFVHSSRTFGVRVDPLFASRYYAGRYARARRMLSFSGAGGSSAE